MKSLVLRVFLASVGIALLVTAASGADEAVPEPVVWSGHTLHAIETLHDLPASVQTALGVGKTGIGGVAERGGKFNTTDVVTADLPMRRFVIAGMDDKVVLVACEIGGFAPHVEATLYTYTAKAAASSRTWTVYGAATTLKDLAELVRQ